jgi:hypothetical protein
MIEREERSHRGENDAREWEDLRESKAEETPVGHLAARIELCMIEERAEQIIEVLHSSVEHRGGTVEEREGGEKEEEGEERERGRMGVHDEDKLSFIQIWKVTFLTKVSEIIHEFRNNFQPQKLLFQKSFSDLATTYYFCFHGAFLITQHGIGIPCCVIGLAYWMLKMLKSI